MNHDYTQEMMNKMRERSIRITTTTKNVCMETTLKKRNKTTTTTLTVTVNTDKPKAHIYTHSYEYTHTFDVT